MARQEYTFLEIYMSWTIGGQPLNFRFPFPYNIPANKDEN